MDRLLGEKKGTLVISSGNYAAVTGLNALAGVFHIHIPDSPRSESMMIWMMMHRIPMIQNGLFFMG